MDISENDSNCKKKLADALDAARRGFQIFPCKRWIDPGPDASDAERLEAIKRAKTPAIDNWQNEATTDPAKIRHWFTKEFPGANIGGAMDGFLAVDADGEQGETDLALWRLTEDFPDTAISTTWSGSKHHIFKLPPRTYVGNSVKKVAAGIDIRGTGGLIVLPGSTIAGKQYRWADDRKPVAAPEWLIKRCKAPAPKAANAGKRVAPADERAWEEAVSYLANEAAPAIQGHGGDAHTLNVAHRVLDFGCDAEMALEAMSTFWNPYCIPSWDEAGLKQKIQNAQRYRQKPIGIDHPSASFEPYKIETATSGIENGRARPDDEEKSERKMSDEQQEVSPQFSDDSLALRFAVKHAGTLRYVAALGKWFIWDGTRWVLDETLLARKYVRNVCRKAATECNKDKESKQIASAKTVSAVERLAQADHRIAATVA
jgi:Bifunctional DNA primase/polymerase, N-terminal/D5 N terminal like